MGEVYLAQDTKLDRKVALKILPAEVASNRDRMERFIREPKSAAALNHPNIATIHEIGEHDGTHFIAMEFIDGVTLRDLIHARQTDLAKLLRYLQHVAEGLAKAHTAGIVHRDLKPDNIMVTRDGHAKILDFGLAKLIEQRPASTSAEGSSEVATAVMPQHSTPGTVMGTVGYMSPEQAQGKTNEIDHRSDIFSFGCILYEAVTGHKAFEGKDAIDSLNKIIREPFSPISNFNAAAPADLQKIVRRCLAKDADERYQSIKDVAIELREVRHEMAGAAEIDTTVPPSSSGEAASRLSAEAVSGQTASGATSAQQPSISTHPSSAEYIVTQIKQHKKGFGLIATGVLALAIVAVVSYFWISSRRAHALTDKDTILLADFVNTTGDAVFDGTLKQALAVQLGQSPFLNIFGDERVREALRFMGRSPDERVTRDIGREICQRQGLKAVLAGSISGLGSHYVITLEAINAQTGDTIAREQAEAENKEQVLKKLGEAATKLREKLGESLASIQKFDVPLEQATTASLEALKAFTEGRAANLRGKYAEAISDYKHAVELDTNFARAYASLSVTYGNNGQHALAVEAAEKAYDLRARASEREQFYISGQFYRLVTGEIDKTIEVMERAKQNYPRDDSTLNLLAVGYSGIGQYEKALANAKEAVRLNPTSVFYSNLALQFRRLSRFEEAKQICEQALAQKLESNSIHARLYEIAFVTGDTAAMKQQIEWASAKPGELVHLVWQSGTAAFLGQLRKAKEFSDRAADLAQRGNLKEVAAGYVSNEAVGAALYGNCQQVKENINRALAISRNENTLLDGAISLALCGDIAQFQSYLDELAKTRPKDTLNNAIWIPTVRAILEIRHGNDAHAIELLQEANGYGGAGFFWPDYMRGQAYLGEHKGAEAAAEFQRILDHRGWDPSSPLYPLAHLGLARAAVLQGDTAKARKAYQDFFALWKDADPDLPILVEAKKEYEKLK